MKNKTAVITGASSGLGREIALVFAENGWNCVLAARSKDKLDALQKELSEKFGGDHLSAPADLSKPGEVEKLFREAGARYGRLDAVINNAGGTYLWPLTAHSPEKILELNALLVDGNALMHRFALENFHERAGGKGTILDVLSSSAVTIYGHNPVYGAGKEYLKALSQRNQKDEPEAVFIRFYPSNIDTPLVNSETASPEVWGSIQKARKLSPKTAAKAVFFLTQAGKSGDVSLEETESGPVAKALEFNPPTENRLLNLELNLE